MVAYMVLLPWVFCWGLGLLLLPFLGMVQVVWAGVVQFALRPVGCVRQHAGTQRCCRAGTVKCFTVTNMLTCDACAELLGNLQTYVCILCAYYAKWHCPIVTAGSCVTI
jgi:hypothetical protein